MKTIAANLGISPTLVHLPMPMVYAATRLLGWLFGDVILTKQEYSGLVAGLLAPDGPSTGKTRLSDWLKRNHRELGATYSSEVARHFGTVSQIVRQ